jgi:xanthine dehydrogenase small subunit
MPKSNIEFLLNDKLISINNQGTNTTVLNYIRNEKNLKGTKEGCASGDCGACTAVVAELVENKLEYKTINTCITFLYNLHGKQLITVENLDKKNLHPVQKSMIKNDGSQCGFCTPGIIMSMYGMYKNKTKLTNQNIEKNLAGNLCRCTGYKSIKIAAKNIYKNNIINNDDRGILNIIKKIPRKDIHICLEKNNFYIHYNLKGLLKDIKKVKKPIFVTGGTDIALEVTKKHNNLNNIFYLGLNKDLNFIKIKKNNMHIGSATSINKILPHLEKIYPSFSKMFLRYGSEQIRNVASIGGNIASASPIGDASPVLIALDSKIIIEGINKREILLKDFFKGYRRTLLKNNEIIREIVIPIKKKSFLKCYKISKRIEDDISSIFMAISGLLKNNVFNDIKIVCGGMAATPSMAIKTQKFLLNKTFTQKNINEAKKIILTDFKPLSDMRASSKYRSLITQNLLERFYLERHNKKWSLD